MTYLLVFCLGAVIDVMYVLWIRAVNQRQIFRAGVYSIGIAAPGIFGYLEIVSDTLMAVPYLLGLALGTMATLRFGKKKEKPAIELQLTPQEVARLVELGWIAPYGRGEWEFTDKGEKSLMEACDLD